jgi:predicted phage baseplate assembly protein
MESLALSWVGVNAVEIDQRQTVELRVVGISSGSADPEISLGAASVEPESLVIEVEEQGRGYVAWARVADLATAGRDAAVYTLDAEAGTIRFGDGVRGRIPDRERRVRVARMRAGGGAAGNLPSGTLTAMTALDLDNTVVTKLKILQGLPTDGGDDAETLAEAERRIPAVLRHRDRAVTEEDYRRLAAETPGVRVGRVAVLPRFKPHQRRRDVPGVVSVVVLPFKEERQPPNPRADRPFLEAVHGYLDARRPLAAELYTIGCEYVPLGVSVGLTLREGFGRDTVFNAVREELRRHLWPLEAGGLSPEGWPFGKEVRDRELEVVVARVEGVATVAPVNLFTRQGNQWRILPRADANATVTLTLDPWQLPELLSVVVVADSEAPTDLRGVPSPFPDAGHQVAVPVVPEFC